MTLIVGYCTPFSPTATWLQPCFAIKIFKIYLNVFSCFTVLQTVLEDPRQEDVNERLSQLNVSRNTVIIQRLVQEGAFGRIYRGLLRQPHNGDKLQNVLIKTVTGKFIIAN